MDEEGFDKAMTAMEGLAVNALYGQGKQAAASVAEMSIAISLKRLADYFERNENDVKVEVANPSDFHFIGEVIPQKEPKP